MEAGRSMQKPIVSPAGVSTIEYVADCVKRGPEELMKEFNTKNYNPVPDHIVNSNWNTKANASKNRFSNVPCWDLTRVVLKEYKGEESSGDYIHANYVDSFNHHNKFIMTQAPLMHTMIDLWRMVWQEDVRVIVMLTGIIEKGKLMSCVYWPQTITEVHKHNLFYVQNVKRTQMLHVDHTELDVTYDTNDKEDQVAPRDMVRRKVHHVHYYGWPDQNLPGDIPVLVNLLNYVNNLHIHPSHKIIVHCNGGVGRAAVFVMLDILIGSVVHNSRLDIHKTLMEVRSQRFVALQTCEQYATLHMALLWYILNHPESIQ